jgi:hypothetical protein
MGSGSTPLHGGPLGYISQRWIYTPLGRILGYFDSVQMKSIYSSKGEYLGYLEP